MNNVRRAPPSGVDPRVPVDAHVHLHPSHDLGRSLGAALRHFHAASPGAEPAGILLLVEAEGARVFAELRDGRRRPPGPWSIESSEEEVTLFARHESGRRIALVAGRQVATRERLEVLISGTEVEELDGLPFQDVLTRALEIDGGLVAVPWGFGKWWGRRGRLVRDAVEEHGAGIYLGDNGGRPRTAPPPAQFRSAPARGVRVLPGSDPLPLRDEERRTGSYGFLCPGPVRPARPFASVRASLMADAVQPPAYGRRVGWLRFIRTQTSLRRAGWMRRTTDMIAGEAGS